MSEEHKTSPYRRFNDDIEAGPSARDYASDDDDDFGVFHIILNKSAPADQLHHWRVSLILLVYNYRCGFDV